ncbi:Histidine phosphatase superfamily clade-1 [Penicillium sp. IBT 16267x]|nr:Histidine phosphatase superfamily clade-1 [Penicillium sp. IBT 16267x]
MPFRLHLIRHAEGIHNPGHDTTILDPVLTERGIKQSEDLCHNFPFRESVGLVITSPLTRTLHTALVGFQKTLDEKYYANNSGVAHGANLLLEPDIQAHSAHPCDTGSDWSVLRSRFPDLSWDLLEQDPAFPDKTGRYVPEREALEHRGNAVQQRLEKQFEGLKGSDRPDIALVTHGGFMKFVSNDQKVPDTGKSLTVLVTFDEESRLIVQDIAAE